MVKNIDWSKFLTVPVKWWQLKKISWILNNIDRNFNSLKSKKSHEKHFHPNNYMLVVLIALIDMMSEYGEHTFFVINVILFEKEIYIEYRLLNWFVIIVVLTFLV